MEALEKAVSERIKADSDMLAVGIVNRIFEQWPKFERMAPDARSKSVRDVGYHLAYLGQALSAGDPVLYSEYIGWVKVLFSGLQLPPNCLPITLQATEAELAEQLDSEALAGVQPYFEAARHQVLMGSDSLPSLLEADAPFADLARQYLDTLLRGDRRLASKLILDAVESGVSVQDIYGHVFQPVQREIGRLWQTNQISVAQEHFCTASTQLIMSQLYPYVFASTRIGARMVATCVGNDLHEIGVRMVADFFEMSGWDTYYLGANTPTEDVLRAIEEQDADLVGVSATMTYHVDHVADLVETVRVAGLNKKVKILVGGYPFNIQKNLWQHVGADGYAPDAQSAVQAGNRLAGVSA